MSRTIDKATAYGAAVLLVAGLLLAPQGANGGPTGRFLFEATSGDASDTLEMVVDIAHPQVNITSPPFGSVLGGASITFSGTVIDRVSFDSDPDPSLPVTTEVVWRLWDQSSGTMVQTGRAPLVDGRFTVVAVSLPAGEYALEASAMDAAGNVGFGFVNATLDPNAPELALVSPLDGEAVLAAQVAADLNFAAPTTIVAVNGVPDGRSFPAGFASGALDLPLVFGENIFTLDVESGGSVFQFSFTIFRVDELGQVRIESPAHGKLVNTPTITVRGTVPRGTPLVEVNGIPGVIAADGVSFEVVGVPIREGRNELVALAHPTGQRATIDVAGDFAPPTFLAVIPEDGTATADSSVELAGFLDEAAIVTLSGPFGSVSDASRLDTRFGDGLPGFDFQRFILPEAALELGSNVLTLSAVDQAGNEAILTVEIDRRAGALDLASPIAGSVLPGLTTNIVLEALTDVTIESWHAGARRLASFEGAALSPGLSTFNGVPLLPGANEMRVVYRTSNGPVEVLTFRLDSSADPETAELATVTGVVTDASTGFPVAGALVTLRIDGLEVVVLTDASGHFTALVPAGDVEIEVSSEGFLLAGASGVVLAGGTLVADAALNPWGTGGGGAPPTAVTIVGTVIDTGTGVRLPRVPVDCLGTSLFAITDADGRFVLEGVPLGNQTFRFHKEGALDEFVILHDVKPLPSGGPLELTFRIGFDMGDVGTLAVDPDASGQILDSLSLRPIAGAEVEARVLSTGALRATATSDAQGEFSLAGLTPFETLEIKAVHPGHTSESLTVLVVPNGDAQLALRLGSLAEGEIAGSVTDAATGMPVELAEIRPIGSALTAASAGDGQFSLLGVPPGTYDVEVVSPEYFPRLVPGVAVAADAAATLTVSLDARPKTGHLEGVVRDAATSAPISGATLIGPAGIVATSDSQGRYAFASLPSGLVELAIEASDFPAASRTAVVDADVDALTPTTRHADFTLGAGAPPPVEITATVPVTGKVLELPDGSASLGIPPLSLSGDAVVTFRKAPAPRMAVGEPLALDPALGLEDLVGLGAEIEITIQSTTPGAVAPIFIGPVFLDMRYSGGVASSAGVDEAGIRPAFYDADRSQWTLPRLVPHMQVVDRVNRRAGAAVSLSFDEQGNPIVAHLETAQPVQLAAQFPDLPKLTSIRKHVLGLLGWIKDAVVISNVADVIFLAPQELDSSLNEQHWNLNARPLLVFHGWDPGTMLKNNAVMTRGQATAAGSRYQRVMSDLARGTRGVYRPVFITYNSRMGLESIGNAVRAKLDSEENEALLQGEPLKDQNGQPVPGTPGLFSHVDSFGFSMGGLSERAYQRAHGPDKAVNSMVSMATPHHGALNLLRLAASGAFGAIDFAAFPVLDVILGRWSPGTADLLDYSDFLCRFAPSDLSGNKTLCEMNRDTRSGPVKRMSLIAGTDSNRVFDLFENADPTLDTNAVQGALGRLKEFMNDHEYLDAIAQGISEIASEGAVLNACIPSDGIVCAWSAHAKTAQFGGGPVPALADKIAAARKRVFDHHKGGSNEQPISDFMESDIFPFLTDAFDARAVGELELELPASGQPGSLTGEILVEYNAPGGSLIGVVPVAYGGYLDETDTRRWKIIDGAEEDGEPDMNKAQSTLGNSVEGEGLTFDLDVPIPADDGPGGEPEFDRLVVAMTPIGPLHQTAPLEPEGGFVLVTSSETP